MRLDCDGKHEFCRKCIEGWFKEHTTCPLCRHQFDRRSEFACALNRDFANTHVRRYADVNGANTGLNVVAGFSISTGNAMSSPFNNLAMPFLLLAFNVSHRNLTLLLAFFVVILINC